MPAGALPEPEIRNTRGWRGIVRVAAAGRPAPMNPFLFKAHPLLAATIGLLSGAGDLRGGARLLIGYLVINLVPAIVLSRNVRRSVHLRLRFIAAYLLALPATVFYIPLALTLLGDITRQTFRLDERYIFLFALLVAVALLAALYGAAIHRRPGGPVGLEAGLSLALSLLLASIPYGLVLLGLDHVVGLISAAVI